MQLQSRIVEVLRSCTVLAVAAGWLLAVSTSASAHEGVEMTVLDERGERTLYQAPGSDVWRDLDRPEAFRIASITKTYVAATVLRLVEAGRLELDDTLSSRLSPATIEQLSADGYDVDGILIRHLLSHTAGLPDPTRDPRFIATWKKDEATHWTREDHLRALVDWTDPAGEPGEAFAYSDSGYVLLGEVVERVTGKPLATVVRTSLRMEANGLAETWWEDVEDARTARAHQFMEGADTHGWSPTLDLYGGGGLVATTADVARFFRSLFSGCVFDSTETLEAMVSSKGLPQGSPYRLGIFEYRVAGRPMYGHSGYWGTWVAFDPLTRDTVAIAVRDQRDARQLQVLAASYFEDGLPDRRPGGTEARNAQASVSDCGR